MSLNVAVVEQACNSGGLSPLLQLWKRLETKSPFFQPYFGINKFLTMHLPKDEREERNAPFVRRTVQSPCWLSLTFIYTAVANTLFLMQKWALLKAWFIYFLQHSPISFWLFKYHSYKLNGKKLTNFILPYIWLETFSPVHKLLGNFRLF